MLFLAFADCFVGPNKSWADNGGGGAIPRLFFLNAEPNMMSNYSMHGINSNQDKKAYCKLGEKIERQFLANAFDCGMSFVMNPSKHENKYTHDFFAMFPCDLKTQFTKFRTADRYNIDPDYAITINKKDIDRYNRLYPHIILIIDVQFPEYKSTHYAPLFMLNRLINKGSAKLHTYQQRVDDNQGNARDSYVFDSRWFPAINPEQ